MASDSGEVDGLGDGRVLVVVAAPAEARAVLRGLGCTDDGLAGREWVCHRVGEAIDLVVCGVGKANAAGATGRVLDPAVHRGVVSLGIGGGLPPRDGVAAVPIGGVVVSSGSVFADDGLLGDDGFTDQGGLGFPAAPGVGVVMPVDGGWLGAALRRATSGAAATSDPGAARAHTGGLGSDAVGGGGADTGPGAKHSAGPAVGRIATVSTCSGTDAAAGEVVRRTGAIVEAMEGAAVGLVAHRLGVRFGEVRVVSNTTGSRTRQVWDLRGALARLSDVASALPAALRVRAGEAGEA